MHLLCSVVCGGPGVRPVLKIVVGVIIITFSQVKCQYDTPHGYTPVLLYCRC